MNRLKKIVFSRLFFTGILIIAQMTWLIIIYLKLVETTAYFAAINKARFNKRFKNCYLASMFSFIIALINILNI